MGLHQKHQTLGVPCTTASPRKPRRGSFDAVLPGGSPRAAADTAASFAALQLRCVTQLAAVASQARSEAAAMAQHACLGAFRGANGAGMNGGTYNAPAAGDCTGSILTFVSSPQGAVAGGATAWSTAVGPADHIEGLNGKLPVSEHPRLVSEAQAWLQTWRTYLGRLTQIPPCVAPAGLAAARPRSTSAPRLLPAAQVSGQSLRSIRTVENLQKLLDARPAKAPPAGLIRLPPSPNPA